MKFIEGYSFAILIMGITLILYTIILNPSEADAKDNYSIKTEFLSSISVKHLANITIEHYKNSTFKDSKGWKWNIYFVDKCSKRAIEGANTYFPYQVDDCAGWTEFSNGVIKYIYIVGSPSKDDLEDTIYHETCHNLYQLKNMDFWKQEQICLYVHYLKNDTYQKRYEEVSSGRMNKSIWVEVIVQ